MLSAHDAIPQQWAQRRSVLHFLPSFGLYFIFNRDYCAAVIRYFAYILCSFYHAGGLVLLFVHTVCILRDSTYGPFAFPTVRNLQHHLQNFDSPHPLYNHNHHSNQLHSKIDMATQIPPLLESFLSLPPETSQIVLTGILGASTNWLVLRYLHSLLKPAKLPHYDVGSTGHDEEDVRVVLVSWMRDYSFWKDGAGRLVSHLHLSFIARCRR